MLVETILLRLRKMAHALSVNQDLFICPVCLDLLKNPVTVLCGHSYCMEGLKGCWDLEDGKGVYGCPQCRQTFSPRPILNKNNILADLVEQMRQTRFQAAAAALCIAGPGDVQCDVCTDKKRRAVKSCLDCLLSYCETHYKLHNDVNPGRKHKVVDAIVQLQDRICTHHQKPLEIFCSTDQSCLCLLCMVNEHKYHEHISVAAERKEKQKELKETQRETRERIQEREEEIQELKKAVETVKISAQAAVEDSERMFTEMIRSINRRRSEVTELIRAQEKAEVSQAEGLLKQLEQEIAELKNKKAELEQLSRTQDDIWFLKTFHVVSDPLQSKDLSSIYVKQGLSFEAVEKCVSTLKKELEHSCKQEIMKISVAVTEVQPVFPEPLTREEFLQYYFHFTLDPNTAHEQLHLSEGNKRIERRDEVQSYPYHPERFDGWWYQVLCREGVFRRCYWEIEYSGVIEVAVSYKNIKRKGTGCPTHFGANDKSWRLDLYRRNPSFYHNGEESKPSSPVYGYRIGVYVDHRAGTLAFYSISGPSNKMTLLHRVQTTFTHTLYPGFGFNRGSSLKLLGHEHL